MLILPGCKERSVGSASARLTREIPMSSIRATRPGGELLARALRRIARDDAFAAGFAMLVLGSRQFRDGARLSDENDAAPAGQPAMACRTCPAARIRVQDDERHLGRRRDDAGQ